MNVRQLGDVQTETTRMTERLATDVKRIDDITDYLENQSRRNNLRVDGVKKEKPGETEEPRVVQRELKLPAEQVAALQIERAHRTGAATAQRDRTIVVKLSSFKERDAIIQAARAVKPRGLYVNEDYSQRVITRRKELLPAMREASERGKIAYLSFDKLVVKDRQAPGA